MFSVARLFARWALSGGSDGAFRRPGVGDRAPRGLALASLPRLTGSDGQGPAGKGTGGATPLGRPDGAVGSRQWQSAVPASAPLLPAVYALLLTLYSLPATAAPVGLDQQTTDGTSNISRFSIETTTSVGARANAYFSSLTNVGIGSTSPGAYLDVQMPASPTLSPFRILTSAAATIFEVNNAGTILSGTWNGTAVGATYGGTGQNTSGSTGVPTISSGTWSVGSTLSTAMGGTAHGNWTAGSVIFASSTTALGENNANFFWDNSNSYLGIRTNVPAAILDVRQNGAGEDGRATLTLYDTDTTAASATATLRFQNSIGGTERWWSVAGTPDDAAADAILNFKWNATTSVMTLRGDGNVGVGTTAPGAKLHVYRTTSPTVMRVQTDAGNTIARLELLGDVTDAKGVALEYNGSGNVISLAPYDVVAGIDTTKAITLLRDSGNVGIASTNPQAKLDVGSGGLLVPRNTSDPTGANGMIHYNTTSAKFRGYQGGAWTDLIGGSGSNGWTDDGTVVRLTTSTDQVGIGITAPNPYTRLAVAHPDETIGGITINNLTYDGTGSYGKSFAFWQTDAGIGVIDIEDMNAVSLDTQGDLGVGIGAAAASARVHIRAGSGDLLLGNAVSPGVDILAPATESLRIGANGAEAMVVMGSTNAGNVGIGTTTATVKLHVAGSPSGGYTAAGNAVFGSTVGSGTQGGQGHGAMDLSGTTFDTTAGASHWSTNAAFDNGAWVQRNKDAESWLILQRAQTNGAGYMDFLRAPALGAGAQPPSFTSFMRIAAGGNVGIGSDNPQAKLDVNGTTLKINGVTYTMPSALGAAGSQLTDAAGNGTLSWAAAGGGGGSSLTVQDVDGTPSVGSSVTTVQFDEADGFLVSGTNPTARVDLAQDIRTTANPQFNDLKLTGHIQPVTDGTGLGIGNAAGTHWVTFDTTNQRMGIGTTAPTDRLHVYTSGGSAIEVIETSSDTPSGTGSRSNLNMSRRRLTAPGTVSSGDDIGVVIFRGMDGSGTPAYQTAAAIEAAVDGTPGADDMPGRLRFLTTPDGSSTAVERMRINNAGNVTIGTASVGSGFPLLVDGEESGSSLVEARIQNSTSTGSWPAPSAANERSVMLDLRNRVPSTSRNYRFQVVANRGDARDENFEIYDSTSGATGNNPRLSIDDAGDVGIGTEDPVAKLHVEGSTLRINGVTYTWPSADGSSGQQLSTNGTGTLSWTDQGGGGAAAPTGSMIMYGAASAPSGWLLCDGAAVSRATYSALFAIIGTTFGAGDGSTTFNLPDLRQRFPLGKAASGTGSTLGGTGGNVDHSHTYSTVISHTHSIDPPNTTSTSNGSHNHSQKIDTRTFDTNGGSTAQIWEPGGVSTQDTQINTTQIGGASTNHTHDVDVGSFTSGGASGGAASGTTTTGNPPFLSLNFIIKT